MRCNDVVSFFFFLLRGWNYGTSSNSCSIRRVGRMLCVLHTSRVLSSLYFGLKVLIKAADGRDWVAGIIAPRSVTQFDTRTVHGVLAVGPVNGRGLASIPKHRNAER
jgi:hypothetical protein